MEHYTVLAVGLAVGLLLLSIIRFSVHPFLALLGSALVLGIMAGQGFPATIETILDGFADTLRWIGLVMVLGTLIGEILHKTGASYRIADSILRLVGKKRIPLTMGLTGYVVSIPVFVDVAYIMLQPIVESLARHSRLKLLVVGLSLTAGLTATHALLPPTPGPLAGAGILGADLGRAIILNIVVALFAVAGGISWVLFYCSRVSLPFDTSTNETTDTAETFQQQVQSAPSAFGSFTPILLPLALIASASFMDAEHNALMHSFMRFLGHPVVALMIGVAGAAFLLKSRPRMKQLGTLLDGAITKSAVVIMITGAGGAFGAVIKAADIGASVTAGVESIGIPGILLPFMLAAAMTTSTGSLTVSMVTTASLMAALLPGLGMSPEMALALIGAGSFCVIHANSSFFWLLSKLHDVPPQILYRTFTMQSLCMGIGGFIGASILWICGIR
jgi:gluconate:H+ symporter, GntP family